jgi:lipopolysaccharide transport system ATP-binding protein
MRPIIQIENVGKEYRIASERSGYTTLREEVVGAFTTSLKRLRGEGPQATQAFWAVRGVDLDVLPGERLGIIGCNGAGKSTLLKILSRITEPTEGRVRLYGRVGSLLEVGTGFHGELTGRENIYLNGAILGMKHAEIARNFDEIVAFSGAEKFLNIPVKRFSSGLYMRLAFAVAAHLQPEILIVDEVLAVGDAAFQKKCLGKMSEVSRDGRTVIFVSHNMSAVQNLCSRVVWMNGGRVVQEGEPARVINDYLRTTLTTMSQQTWNDPATAPGNDRVRIHRAAVTAADGAMQDHFTVRTPLRVTFEYWNLTAGAPVNLGVVVQTEEGYPIFSTSSMRDPDWPANGFPVGLFRSSFDIPADLLNDGVHRVQLTIHIGARELALRFDDILVFDVLDAPEERTVWFGKYAGAIRPPLRWRTGPVDGLPAETQSALTGTGQ